MNNYRIYVEKYPEFQVEARSLLNELNENLQLTLPSLRYLNVYDLFGFSEELLEKSRYSVFGEVVTDSVTDEYDLSGTKYIAVECLPGQFDQRAASAVDCVRLIDPAAKVNIRASKLIILPGDTADDVVDAIKKYYINAVESREKDLSKLSAMEQPEVTPVPVLEGLTALNRQNRAEYLIATYGHIFCYIIKNCRADKVTVFIAFYLAASSVKNKCCSFINSLVYVGNNFIIVLFICYGTKL